MAPIDNGEEKIERVSSDVSREGARVVIKFAGEETKRLTARALRLGAKSLQWTMAAVQRPGGEVSMKELSELPSRAGRELVSLDDKDVMQALEKNLKGRGVHYAIEREKIDGKVQHILHVRGDDAQVVADSLERAAESVDAKRERKQERSVERETPKQERSEDSSTPKQKQPSQNEQSRVTDRADSQVPKQAKPTTSKEPGFLPTIKAPTPEIAEAMAAREWAHENAPHLVSRRSPVRRAIRLVSPPLSRKIAQRKHDKLLKAYREAPKSTKPEPSPAREKRSNPEAAQKQKEIRAKVKARAAEIKTATPKRSPKIDAPKPGLKR